MRLTFTVVDPMTSKRTDAVAVLGSALLALGVAGLVPPLRGLDGPSSAFRLATVPRLLPGAWLTYLTVTAFRTRQGHGQS